MKKLKKIEAYYCPGKGFFTRNNLGEWVNTDKETVRMKLIRAGFASDKDGAFLSPASEAMLEIIENETIHFAGNLAGAKSGLLEIGTSRILVTTERRAIKPKRGRMDLIEKIFDEQYGGTADYLLTWMKFGAERARNGGGAMLPALIIAGAADTAKSFVQNFIITPLLGGRMAKPWRYWTGGTEFNEDLCGAEHLMIEDENGSVKFEKKKLFGDALKQSIASEFTSLHPKGGKAFTVKCVWAISASTNLEPQNLRLFPFHDASMADKLLVLHCKQRPSCLPDPNDYDAFLNFSKKIQGELSALAAFLERYKPPAHCRGEKRSAVAAWRDPEIVELVSDDDNVPKLIWLIDDLKLFGDGLTMERTFTSMELEREIISADKNYQARKILDKASLAYLLREAAKRFPDRVEKCGESHGGLTRWKLKPAPKVD